MPGYSILILTLNEERRLPGCLESVAGSDDVVVLDSGSTDRTAEIARAAGARVFVRPFDTFAGQRNHAQREIPFRHPWVFHLDADERTTADLARACAAAAGRTDLDGFWVAPRMLFHGRWIPRSTDFPAWQARFVRAPSFSFIDAGHGQREAPGQRLERMQGNYLHELMGDGGEEEWLSKHRRYAKAEALAHRARGPGGAPLRGLIASDPLRRRRALKEASYRLPFRPLLRFAYQYLLRGGFLDGRPGLSYCRLLARYEGFAAAELSALRRRGEGPPAPNAPDPRC